VTAGTMERRGKGYRRDRKCKIKQKVAKGRKHKQNLDLNAGDEGERFSLYSGDVQKVFIASYGLTDPRCDLDRN
jgi:hypothetical protein